MHANRHPNPRHETYYYQSHILFSSHLAALFLFFFVFGGSKSGINHRIISSLDECNPTGCPTLHVQAELYHEQHDHLSAEQNMHPTYPACSFVNSNLMHNYINKTQKNIMEITACRYPSRWQSLPAPLCCCFFLILKPYSIPLSLHRITSIPSASWRL
ncbi:hypothetical protein HDV62DRAFT_266041 [Trichoderma sp. SZMC 28011]